MRIWLCYRRGAKSFEDLRTVSGVLYDTYIDAELASVYLDDDSEWHRCMSEASTSGMPSQLRVLFAVILVYCEPGDTTRLWRESIHTNVRRLSAPVRWITIDLVDDLPDVAVG